MNNICYVCECGWIIVGRKENETNKNICLKDASIVRYWDNGRGIGGIAKTAYKDEYTLDPIGDVTIINNKVLFEIPCGW